MLQPPLSVLLDGPFDDAPVGAELEPSLVAKVTVPDSELLCPPASANW